MKLLKQLIIILLLLIAIDRVFGNYFDSIVVPKINCGYYKKVSDYLFISKSYDIAIYGNSRAMHQYVPIIFKEQLGQHTFNAGMDGTGLHFQRILLSHYLKRHHPKLIIIDINNRELENSSEGDKAVSLKFLSPFLNSVPEIKELLNLSVLEKIAYLSNFYRYNTKFYSLIVNQVKCRDRSLQEGYDPFYGRASRDISKYTHDEYPIDDEQVNLLKSIIELCKQQNIKLLFVFSPKQIDDRQFYSREMLTKIFTENNIPFLDFTHDENFKNEKLFYDRAHLNDEGALIFSRLLSQKIIENKILN